jgi:hypothetical protein
MQRGARFGGFPPAIPAHSTAMSPAPPEAGLAIAPPSTAAPELGFDDLRLPTTGALLAGRYRLEHNIGKGGYGIVFAATDLHLRGSTATDTHLRGQVAVKLLLPRCNLDLARFRRELASLRLIDLPGVVRWLDAGAVDGQMFVVTELIDGVQFPGIERPCTWEALAPIALHCSRCWRVSTGRASCTAISSPTTCWSMRAGGRQCSISGWRSGARSANRSPVRARSAHRAISCPSRCWATVPMRARTSTRPV